MFLISLFGGVLGTIAIVKALVLVISSILSGRGLLAKNYKPTFANLGWQLYLVKGKESRKKILAPLGRPPKAVVGQAIFGNFGF